MPTTQRRPRRLIPLTATAALVLTAAVVPSAAAVDVTHTIAQVQGTGAAIAVTGTVTVEGVVTADLRSGGYGGVFLQTEGSGGAPDATPGASDGIFVFLGSKSTTLDIGDLARVTGTASDRFGNSQISASAAAAVVEDLGVSTAPPAVTALPDTLVGADREQLEGVLVSPTGDYLVSSFHQLTRFGSLWLSAGTEPLVKSTATQRPGTAADAIVAANLGRRLLLDDGRSTTLTGATPATTQPYLPTPDAVRTGDAVDFTGLSYVLGYDFNDWRLQPLSPLDATTDAALEPTFVERNARPGIADVGGDLTLAAFNVLNYFTTLGARGAETAGELAIQKAKIVAAITALDADVVAVQEIENAIRFGGATPDVALADLVDGLNAAAGAAVWAYVPTPTSLYGVGAPATDEIMSAIIYRSDAVTRVGESVADVDETVWDIAREPIAQTFTTADGDPFVVVANHFKSKGGSGTEPADGQGFFNAERVEQANALVAFADEVATAAGTTDVALLGDFNAYAQEDPIAALTAAGYTDVMAAEPAEHSYTFNGELGSLDHALLSPSFVGRMTGAEVWDINADEWSGYEYWGAAAALEASSVFRASDHDPIRVGITATAPPVTIDLLGINDFHGRLEASGAVAGAAVLAGYVNAARTANPNTVFFSAGDSIGASTFTSFIQQDDPTIAALNAMGLEVTALGNHEFDQGRVDLDDRVLPASDFPYLGANVYDRATGLPAYDDSFVTEVDGVSVGFIGAVTAELPSLVTPAGIASLEVKPVLPEVNRVAADLTDGDPVNGEADVIVLLLHEGAASADLAASTDGSGFGQLVTGASPAIDVIYSGHTHQRYAHLVPVDGWTSGLNRPVVQAGQYGEAIGRVTLTVDRASGEVLSNAAVVTPLAGSAAPDPEVAAIVADAALVANELGSVSLGQITASFNRARTVAGAENRGGESTLGNVVADAQLWATSALGTQIAFMNPGGLRANLTYASSGASDPDGNLTFKEAATVQPFANTLVTMSLTGAQVISVLEEQWQPAGAQRPFLKLGVAGLTYTYDPTAAAGARITEVRVGDAPLDLAGSYKVVVNSFLSSGGDNFATLAAGTGRADSGRVDLQAFVDYVGELTPIGPDLGQRAVGVQLLGAPADGYLAGDTVTANLSSLLFSGGESQATEVTLTAGGATLGTFPIDPTIVDTTDEVGRAAVTFTVPQGLAGETLAVEVTTASGTASGFTIPLAEAAVPTCTVDYSALRLGKSFLGRVQVVNNTDTAVRGWTLTWTYARGEKVTTGIGASVRQAGTLVTARSTWFSSTIYPGRSVSFALIGKAPNGIGTPTGFALDGLPCEVAP